MFESLFDVLNINLRRNNAVIVKLPDEISEHKNPDSQYIIKNWLFQSSQFRKWRITRLDGGEKIQVFNTVAYPSFSSEKPILGVDILWFGSSKKLLAVLDYQPLIQEEKYLYKYCSKLDLIRKKYPNFDNTKMKNIYDSNNFFSPWVIIFRGNKLNINQELNNVFNMFLKEYFKMHSKENEGEFLDIDEIKNKHIDYDKYSAEKDPAGNLFKTFFGKSWTEDFVSNFLFTLNKN